MSNSNLHVPPSMLHPVPIVTRGSALRTFFYGTQFCQIHRTFLQRDVVHQCATASEKNKNEGCDDENKGSIPGGTTIGGCFDAAHALKRLERCQIMGVQPRSGIIQITRGGCGHWYSSSTARSEIAPCVRTKAADRRPELPAGLLLCFGQ